MRYTLIAAAALLSLAACGDDSEPTTMDVGTGEDCGAPLTWGEGVLDRCENGEDFGDVACLYQYPDGVGDCVTIQWPGECEWIPEPYCRPL